MQRKTAVSLLLSLTISVILIGVLFSKIEIDDFIQTFARIYCPALLTFILIALGAAVLRAWRYKWLLHPQPIEWRDVFLVTFIRNLFVDLFPARIGSLSYIYVLNRSMKYSFEAAASSFVVAFIYDFLTLPPFLVFALVSVGLAQHRSPGFLFFWSLSFFSSSSSSCIGKSLSSPLSFFVSSSSSLHLYTGKKKDGSE
jgi:uncharacterized membrane protein YbhN (UPF0104 family)